MVLKHKNPLSVVLSINVMKAVCKSWKTKLEDNDDGDDDDDDVDDYDDV